MKIFILFKKLAGGIISPYFFQDEVGNAVTINGIQYPKILNVFFLHLHQRYELRWHVISTWWRHMSHTTWKFDWPPKSYDITPLNLLLWSYLKGSIYVNKPAMIPALEEIIGCATIEIEWHYAKVSWKTLLKQLGSFQYFIQNSKFKLDNPFSISFVIEGNYLIPVKRDLLPYSPRRPKTDQKVTRSQRELGDQMTPPAPFGTTTGGC